MFKTLQENPLLVVVVIIVGYYLLQNIGLIEGFNTCYHTKNIQLNDVTNSDPSSSGHATMETNRGKLYVEINAVIHDSSGYTGNYSTCLYNRDTGDTVPLGYMLKYGPFKYRLVNDLLGNYSGYTDVLVFKKNEYGTQVVLQGNL